MTNATAKYKSGDLATSVGAVKQIVYDYLTRGGDLAGLTEIREVIHRLSPIRSQPIDFVRWVPIEKVKANDYNPNNVAGKEMGLLYLSIKNDGYTQPIVTFYDKEKGHYIIVDGFHRFFTAQSNPDILKRNLGHLPVVVIEKSLADRMASTVRHNRARGEHSVKGMANMVYTMLDEGKTDAEICNNLGMEVDELMRLKHITGFSTLFEGKEWSLAWKSKNQILLEKEHGALGFAK